MYLPHLRIFFQRIISEYYENTHSNAVNLRPPENLSKLSVPGSGCIILLLNRTFKDIK